MSGAAVEVEALRFTHQPVGDAPPFALRVDQLTIPSGARWALVGASGSGKTTLLELLGGVRLPTSGSIHVDGTLVTAASEAARRRFRLRRMGWIHQQFGLLPYLSALENILLPIRLDPAAPVDKAARARAEALAEATGLRHRLGHSPRRLSQGERQRVALCRALVTDPPVVLADEPTGNLDAPTAAAVMDLLQAQLEARGATLIMATHDRGLLARFDHVLDVATLSAGEAPSEPPA